MTNEQIRQNAADYVYNFQPTGVITEDRLKCYIAGAHSRDEEINKLKSLIKMESEIREGLLRDKHKLQEDLDKLRNPN